MKAEYVNSFSLLGLPDGLLSIRFGQAIPVLEDQKAVPGPDQEIASLLLPLDLAVQLARNLGNLQTKE
jgi:hypothetical protein